MTTLGDVLGEDGALTFAAWLLAAAFGFISGAVLGAVAVNIIRGRLASQRAEMFEDEGSTEEATATVLEKERSERYHKGWLVEVTYKVSYVFPAEKADDIPCNVRVMNRLVGKDVWEKLLEGGTLQVVYLTGHPESCRMRDMGELAPPFPGGVLSGGELCDLITIILLAVFGFLFLLNLFCMISLERPSACIAWIVAFALPMVLAKQSTSGLTPEGLRGLYSGRVIVDGLGESGDESNESSTMG